MDRMASSMKQVPNPLPKVLSRRGVGTGLEAAERESFERTQVRTGEGDLGISGAALETLWPAQCWKRGGVLQAQERTGQAGREQGHLARGPRSRGPGDTPAGLGRGGVAGPERPSGAVPGRHRAADHPGWR